MKSIFRWLGGEFARVRVLEHDVQVKRVHLLTLIVAAAVALVIGFAGGTAGGPLIIKLPTNTPKAAVVEGSVANGHVCDKRDYALSCPLPQASVAGIARGVDPVEQGVDFGWSCPVSLAQSFGASYLSYDPSKDWSLSCVNAFHAAHKGTVAVWEAGANDAQRGYSVGYAQAKQAAAELSALGAPAKQPFDMAVDCDCFPSTLASYFKGADAAEPGRVNAYGGYAQVSWLYSQHLVGHLNWQTYAWSGGQWLPASVAPLEQYLNGSAVDYDRAIAANYGQWPAPQIVPLCSRSQCYGKYASSGSTGYREGPLRGGPFRSSAICQRGCDERQFMYWWNHAATATHSHRLWIRYRLQFLYHRLEHLIAAHPCVNVATCAPNVYDWPKRAHALWVAGELAKRESSFNAYQRVTG